MGLFCGLYGGVGRLVGWLYGGGPLSGQAGRPCLYITTMERNIPSLKNMLYWRLAAECCNYTTHTYVDDIFEFWPVEDEAEKGLCTHQQLTLKNESVYNKGTY